MDVVGDAGLELRWEEVARHRVDHHSGGGHQEHHLRGGQVGLITEEEKDILIFFFWFCWEFRKGKWWWRKSKVVVLVIYNGDFGSVYVWDLPFFDTVKVKTSNAHAIADAALKSGINLRVVDGNTVSVAFCFTKSVNCVCMSLDDGAWLLFRSLLLLMKQPH